MRKLKFTLFLITVFTISLSAQIKVGAGLSLVDGNIGISGKGTVGVNEQFDAGGMISYYFLEGDATALTFDIDAQYKALGEPDGFRLKGIAGLQFARVAVGDFSDTEIGINIGALLEIPVTESLEVYIEPKYVIEGLEDFVISAGVFF